MNNQSAVCDSNDRYLFENLGVTSDLVGPCDVCGDYCSDVWTCQLETYSIMGVVRRWVPVNDPVRGHLDCLELNARDDLPHYGSPWSIVELFGYRVKRTPKTPGRIGCHIELIGPQGEVILRDPSAADLKAWARENLT